MKSWVVSVSTGTVASEDAAVVPAEDASRCFRDSVTVATAVEMLEEYLVVIRYLTPVANAAEESMTVDAASVVEYP